MSEGARPGSESSNGTGLSKPRGKRPGSGSSNEAGPSKKRVKRPGSGSTNEAGPSKPRGVFIKEAAVVESTSSSEEEIEETNPNDKTRIDYMLRLEDEFFKQKASHAHEVPTFKERNPGCWIFGHGDVTHLPHEFTNPILASKFTANLLIMMLVCLFNRTFWIAMATFWDPANHFLYENELYYYPMFGVVILFIILHFLTHLEKFEDSVYHYPYNIIAFVTLEIIFTMSQVLISLAAQRFVHLWYVTLDIFNDHRNNGYDPNDPSYWPELGLTPAIFLLYSNVMCFINLFGVLCLDVLTTTRIGNRDIFRMMVIQTFFMSALGSITLIDVSYRVSPIWDSFQTYISVTWTIYYSFMFVHYMERMLEGKGINLKGDKWEDVIFASIRFCFV